MSDDNIITCPSGLRVRLKAMTVRDERTIQCRDLPSEKIIRLVRNMCVPVEFGPYGEDILSHPADLLSVDADVILAAILAQMPNRQPVLCPECKAPLDGKLVWF